MELNGLEKRILEISKKYNLSHISSCLTSVQLIDDVYLFKKPDEKFILSNGHSGLALYAVIEKHEGVNAEDIYKHHGTHPDRCKKCHIDCSTGSLGQGLPIALGMALANRMREVYVLTSDGEWMEGSMYEALRIAADFRVANLTILVNANGFSAYKEVDLDRLEWQIAGFVKENCPKVAFFRTQNPVGYEGVGGHYRKNNDN